MPVPPDGSILGTDGADTLSGGIGADTIFGFDGDDSLIGEDGDDSLVGGAGNDTLRGGWGDDTLLGGDGDDEIEGLYGNDVIDTGAGNDHVFGRDGDDLIYGREGDDHLIGSLGTDTIHGGEGNDTLAGSQGNDEIHGGDGNDLAFIGVYEGSDSIFMDAGNDFVDGGSAGSSFYAEGGAGNDTLTSGMGDDTLLGGAGNDLLNGGAGNDILYGGGDADVVTGGDGDDVFVLQDVPGTLHILDFGANGAADLIDLSQLSGYQTAEAVSAVTTTGQGTTTMSFAVTGGTLVVTVLSDAPLVASDLGLSGVLEGAPGDDTVVDGGGDDTVDDGNSDGDSGNDGSGTGSTFVLDGPDAGHFVVDPATGAISNMDWFTPSYDVVWDVNGDHIYEVSVVELDANGAETARGSLELVVTPEGAEWRTAGEDSSGGDDDDGSDDGEDPDDSTGDGTGGTVYTLTGEDASIFDVDAGTGEVSYKAWFTPSYEEVWDLDRDHIYEVSVLGSDDTGAEVSRSDLELVVSETDAVWRDALPEGDEETDTDPPTDPADNGSVDGSGGTEGLRYSLAGQDASIFDVEADTCLVSFKAWFQPHYDQVWDLDRDHIYEISVLGTDDAGEEVSRIDLELVVSEDDAIWREAPPEDSAEMPTGEDLMALLFTPMADEDVIPAEVEVEEPADVDI